MRPSNFKEGRFADFERAVIPCQMRRGGIQPRGCHGHDCRIIAPVSVGTANSGGVDFGDQIILTHARFGQFKDPFVHRLDDTCGTLHIFDLALGFDGALPVYQSGRIRQPGFGHRIAQTLMGRGGIIIVVHFHTDLHRIQPQFGQKPCQIFHWVLFGVLHIGVVIAADIFVIRHEHRAPCAKRIH